MRVLLLFLVLDTFLAVTDGCRSGTAQNGGTAPRQPSDPEKTEYVAPDAKGIQTQTVRVSSIPEYLELPAHIEADPTRVVHVFAPAGGRIVAMRVRPWDSVTKDQALAQLESSGLARAVADYHKALADNQAKQKELVRSQDLLVHNAISERQYQQAQSDAEQARAEMEATREQVRVFGMDPDHSATQLVVKAPRSGVVLDIGASPGEFSQALSAPAPLCTIADITEIWAVGDIYEKDLGAAKSGQAAQVTLSAYPHEHWSGRVSVVSDAVDPSTRTLRVRVVLPNSGNRIKPGMFGGIRILRSTASGILVPASAVIRAGDDTYVFVGSGNGGFERRSVTPGRTSDGQAEIVSGINAGEVIVTEGALLLRSAGQN